MNQAGKWPWYEKARAEVGRRGWSYAELARRAGVTESSVHQWLKGKNSPRIEAAVALSKALGIPMSYLFDDDIPYPPEPTEKLVEKAFENLTPDQWRLIQALPSPEAVSWLLSALDHYERFRHPRARR